MGTLLHCWGTCESVWRSLRKLKKGCHLTQPSPFWLFIQQKQSQGLRDVCTPMLTAAVLTIAWTGEQPKVFRV